MRLRQNQTARPLSGCIANASRYQIPLPEKPGTRPAPAEPTIFEPLCTCERVCVGGGKHCSPWPSASIDCMPGLGNCLRENATTCWCSCDPGTCGHLQFLAGGFHVESQGPGKSSRRSSHAGVPRRDRRSSGILKG